ncbi:MAG TPA: NPCBM/NEW2 domain-containing protein, partial [Bacteroidota bacterium]|nr:NPCBM/NEW2 domain-containing protein [Bacteroidota bacterium]
GCGRPIVLSTSPGETPIEQGAHVSTHANMWRIIDDFWDNWSQLNEHFALFERWNKYMGPGHWPDGDMLPLGRIGIRAERGDNRMSLLTRDEQYTLMSLFLICRSPLMFGGNLPDNDDFTTSLITNEEALGVLQHSKNNRLVYHQGGKIAWIADDANSGDQYLALFFSSGQEPVNERLAVWNSRLLTHKPGEQSTNVRVRLKGAKKLYLVVTDGGNGNNWDHADWIEPTLSGKKGTLHLTDLKWVSATSGWGSATLNASVAGNALNVDQHEYANGIGTHANSVIEYDVPEGYDTFSATVGLDKECIAHTEGATVKFHVFTRHPSGEQPKDSAMVSVTNAQLGLKGPIQVRDLWMKQDLGSSASGVSVSVRNHGARLLRIRRNN